MSLPAIYLPRSGLAGASQLVPSLPAGGPWGNVNDYLARVLALNPIACWPMYEAGGSVARDASGNGRVGAYSGVTLGQTGIGDGRTAASFNGTTSYCNVYSASLAAAFNGAEGTLLCWAKVSDAGFWTDGVNHWVSTIQADANNYLSVGKIVTNNTIRLAYNAGGTLVTVDSTVAGGNVGWFPICLTWSKSANVMRSYILGAQVGTDKTPLGTWAGAIITALIGSLDLTPTRDWSGTLAYATPFSRALSPAEVASVSVV
jgi:hypothetical protein